MPALRPWSVVRANRIFGASLPVLQRSFSLTSPRTGGAEPRYDPPTGWLWGVKPGEKYQKEGWETTFYWLYCAPLVACGIFMFFKPDTTIQTWALEEARRRLEKEGILKDPFPDHVEPEDKSTDEKV